MFNEIWGGLRWWRRWLRWWRWCLRWCRASPCWSRSAAWCRWQWAGLRGRRSCSSMNSQSWTPGCTWDLRCWHWSVLWCQYDHDDQDVNCRGQHWCWWPWGQYDYSGNNMITLATIWLKRQQHGYNDNNMITVTTTWLLQRQPYDYDENNTITMTTLWSQSSQWQHLLRLHRHLSVHLNGRELDGNGQTSSSCIVVVMTIIMVDYNTCTMTVFNNLITIHSKDKPAGPVLRWSWQ